ncbi:sensor histidine kinase [Streptomyces sp. BB1-1-1]|uniref:sensor histidine kinase n=1 Tax=Streptomyces sp. BB1-1-1 TaxID=3074430 RepID=UPI002877B800|nr:sensor histidine kinase [Streptomyces sp. BB1-1-1]WND39447.1 sensor histidine kinase [Streptomyces sp. BB1-1-1]
MNALTPTTRALAWSLHLLVAGLLVLPAVRAVADDRPHAPAVIAVAAVVGVVYAVGPALPAVRASRRAAALWLGAVGAVWLALLALSAEGVWLAFPLYFVQLHLLSRRAGLTAVVATAVAAIAAFSAHQGTFTAATAIGPALGAAVAVAVVWGYQTLYRESEQRRRLIEELTVTRADLADAQRAAGVLEERQRLAREIHDTLAQGLSSIQLLLRAAERALPDRPVPAITYVVQARQAAVDNLAEARRFVAALSPPALDGTTLADALDRLCATTGDRHRLDVRFRLAGRPRPLPTAHEVALLRVAQSALANTVGHARADGAEVTLSYLDDAVALGVTDDGVGFDPAAVPAPGPEGGGFGLAAMRARTHALDGTLTVESAPGRGTALAARLPLAPPPTPPRDTDPADDDPEAQP